MNLNRCHPSITWRVARAATIRYRLCVSSNSPDVRSCNALRVKNNPHQLFHPPSHQCRTFATKSKKALSAAKSNGKKATFTKSNSNKAAPTRYYPRKKAAAAKQLNVVKEDIGNDKQAPSSSTFGNINDVFQCCTNQDKMNGLHSSEIVELWSSIPRLLKRERAVNDKKAHHGGNQLQMIQSVRRLMERTTFIIDECDQNELTDIVVYLGRAVHEVKNAREGSSVYHNVFRELFFDNNHPDADVLDKELFKPLAAAARGRLPMFHPRELARLSQSYAMMEHNPQFEDGATLLGEAAFETIIRVDDFSPKGAADTLHAFAKMELPANSLLFQSVGDSIADRHGLDALPPSTITQIVSAYATSQIPHQKLFDRIGDSICERNDLASFKPSELSEILHSYASLNQEHSAMFQKIGDSIVLSKDLGIMRKFQTKDLVSALWSFSKLHESHPDLFAKIADAILKWNDRNALSSEELATVLWAYATEFERNDFVWSSSYKSLFKKLGDIFAFRDLTRCSLESINNVLWAYATCSISHPILFEKVGDAIITREDLASFAPHILWAYTTLNESHPVLSDLKKVMRDNDFLAELSTMTLAKTLFPNEQELELFMKVADHLAKRDDLSSLGSQSILNVLNACTNIKVAHSGLLQAVGDTLSLRNDWKSFDASFLSEIVWAFAACDENHPPLFKVIGDVFIKAGSSASELDTEDCVRLMWACAAANTSQPNVFSEIKDAIATKETDRYSYQFLVKELGVILLETEALASFDSPCLVDLVCAVTSINTSHLSSLKGVGDVLASRDDLTALSTQTLSNLLWSYTNTKSHHPLLFQKVGDVLSTRDDLSISHEVLSRIISSFTRHPAKPHIALLKRIGEVVEHDVDISSSKLSEDVLLDLLLSLSAIESTWPGLLRRIGDMIASRDVDMRIIRPRLTNILLAYTNAGASHPSLFRILAESNPSVFDNFLVQAVNEGFMPRVLLGLASAFASADQKLLRHDKTELFTRIGDAAVHHYKDIGIIPQFSIEDVTNIIAAYNHAKVSAAVLCIVHCSLNIGVIISF